MLEVISVICETESDGRGAAGKVPVFGILKSGGRVYTKVISATKGKTLLGIMQDRIVLDSIVCADTYQSYVMLEAPEFKHYRINHSKRFVKKHKHINGIDNFWNQAKRHLRNFKVLQRQQQHSTCS